MAFLIDKSTKPCTKKDFDYNFIMNFLKEYLQFLKEQKKWILIPILIVFALLSGMIILSTGSSVSPFIYTLF